MLAAAAAAVPASPDLSTFLNTSSRQDVAGFFQYYDSSDSIAMDWTGDTQTCSPGSISSAYLNATVLRINWFRVRGLPCPTSSHGFSFEANYN
jgi:hypothetical protein